MFRSIRGTFLTWQTVLLLLVITGFGVTLYGLVRHSKLDEIDAELRGSAQVFAAGFRPGRPPNSFGRRRRGRRGGRFRERWERWAENGRQEGNRPQREPQDRFEESPTRRRPPADEPANEPSEQLETDRTLEEPTVPPVHSTPSALEPPGPTDDVRVEPVSGVSGRPTRWRPGDYPRWRIHVPEDFLSHFDSTVEGSPYFAVWSSDGELVAEVNAPHGIPVAETSEPGETYSRQRADYREVILAAPSEHTIVIGRSIASELADLSLLVWRISATGTGVLVIGLLGGWFLSKRAIRPIEAISAAAENVSATNLSQRIEIAAPKSELGRLADILNQTFARLQGAFEQQRRFTADASHELRTPVSVILAQASLSLQKERSPEEYREVIEVCYRTSQRMKELVDGLLTLARSDAGKLELDLQTVPLHDLVEDATELVRPLAEARDVQIECQLESTTIRGDPHRLSQVFSNLLTNAIRYNRTGGSVIVSVARTEEKATIVVEDTGIGIAPEDVPTIFDRFYRADKARSRTQGGNGLGLAIARSIIATHGGSIAVTSKVDHGTRFTVTLPLEDADRAFSCDSAR